MSTRTYEPRPLRRDALANQEKVLAAAVTAMLRGGRQVPMASIAELAGVGVGTLYRRYPTRDALLTALTERAFGLVRDLAADAAADDEPGIVSLARFLDGTIQHRDQLVLPLHGGPVELSDESRLLQRAIRAALTRVVHRGHHDGTIRPELRTSDVVVFGAMLAQPLPNTLDWDSVARRQKDVFLAGVATAGAAEEYVDALLHQRAHPPRDSTTELDTPSSTEQARPQREQR